MILKFLQDRSITGTINMNNDTEFSRRVEPPNGVWVTIKSFIDFPSLVVVLSIVSLNLRVTFRFMSSLFFRIKMILCM